MSVKTSDAKKTGIAAGAGKKKKFRNKKNNPEKKVKSVNPAHLPKDKTEFSSNWKSLLNQIGAEEKPKKPKFVQKDEKKIVKKSAEKKVEEKAEIWFDDVDPMLLDPEDRPGAEKRAEIRDENKKNASSSEEAKKGLVKENSFKGLTKIIGIDCEMVGVGYEGKESALARVSIVNHFGHCVYDKYVKPREKVTDYRTAVSGIRPKDIANANDFKDVQKEVSDIFEGRILVGHALKHDMKVLFLTHPKRSIRDTSLYKPFRDAFHGKTPSLKRLSERFLGVQVQEGEHSSVQDAQATIRLYTMFRKEWEKAVEDRRKAKKMTEQILDKRTKLEKKVPSTKNLPGKKVAKKKKIEESSKPASNMYVDSDSE